MADTFIDRAVSIVIKSIATNTLLTSDTYDLPPYFYLTSNPHFGQNLISLGNAVLQPLQLIIDPTLVFRRLLQMTVPRIINAINATAATRLAGIPDLIINGNTMTLLLISSVGRS